MKYCTKTQKLKFDSEIPLLIPGYSKELELPPDAKERFYSCAKCHSACETEGGSPSVQNHPKLYRYKGKEFNHCSHEWERGFSSAYPKPISDGTIILVKKGIDYGAFKLYNQKTEPHSTSFKWWVRADGKGTFNNSAEVKNGDASTSTESPPRGWYFLEFGPFRVKWSANTPHKGFVCYQYYTWDEIPADALQICVTEEKEIDSIDAADPKWEYKSANF